MRIEWEDTARPPTDAEIAEFEKTHDVHLTSEHRWFLQNIANGGRPTENYVIPTTDCPGGAGALHAVYGIGHQEEGYSLMWAISLSKNRIERYFPFGADEVGGDLLIDLVGQRGHLVYNPSDPNRIYHSATSIHDLLLHLRLDEED